MKSSALFREYLVRNLVLALLPMLLVSIWLYGSMREQILVEYEQAQYFVLERMVDSSERVIESFVETAVQIANDSVTSPYQWRSGASTARDAIERLRLYLAKNQYIDEIILKIYGSDQLYTNNGVVSMDAFLNRRYELTGDWDEEEFKALLESGWIGFVSGERYLEMANKRSRIILYPWGTQGRAFGVIVGLVSEDFFNDMLDGTDNTTFILIGDEVMTASSGATDGEIAVLREALKNPNDVELLYLSNQGISYSVVTRSTEHGWQFVSLVRHDGIVDRIGQVQRSLLFMALFLLLSLCCMSVTFARKSYLPIQRIYHVLTGIKQTPMNRDELEDIEKGVRQLALEKEEARIQACEDKNYKQEVLLIRLCTGTSGGDSYRELEKIGIHMPGPGYCVSAIDLGQNVANVRREEVLNALRSQMSGNAYALEVYGQEPIIVLLGDVDSPESLRERIEMIMKIADEKTVRLGVGSYQNEPEKISQSFVDAFVALEASGKRVSYYDEFSLDFKVDEWMLPDSLHIRLIQSIRGGEQVVAMETIEYIQEKVNSLQADKRVRRFALTAFATQLLPLARTLSAPENKVSEGLVFYRDEEEFFNNLRDFCEILMKHLSEKQKKDINALYERVKAYVDEHAYDTSFSLGILAQHFDVTDSYMSRFFRENTGKGFMEYVTDLRMTRAAILLSDTKLNVRQVMEEVGYIDVSSFTRKFTRVMGISPGAYRIAKAKEKCDRENAAHCEISE